MSVNDATDGQADLVMDKQPVRSLRRVGRPWEAARRGARLFLEDLEELEELVEQAAEPDDPDWEARLPVRMETDGWEAAGVRMLLPHIGAGQLRRTRLEARRPDGGLSVRLDPHRAGVTVTDRDDPTMRGLGEHAVELLDRARGLHGRLAGAVAPLAPRPPSPQALAIRSSRGRRRVCRGRQTARHRLRGRRAHPLPPGRSSPSSLRLASRS